MEKQFLEFVMRAIVQEAQRTSSGGRIVYHLCHQLFIIAEIELIAYAYFAGRIHEDIPQLQSFIQFTQEENFDLSTGFLFITIETGGKNTGIVEDENIKSTALRMITTLLAPTRGRATVLGHDIVRERHAVRGLIGVTGSLDRKSVV